MKLLIFVICFTSTAVAQTQSEKQQVHQAVHLVFEAFSEANIVKMEQAVTPDVKILETGEVWTLDTIRSYFRKPRPADFKRVNNLDFFQTEVRNKMAFVSYYNTADIRANGNNRTVKWLESAVLIKDDKTWKVKMLHSTRLEKD
jgi:hypothetical protein